jgi:hypothetical protein
VALPDGRWAEGKHQLLCSYAAKEDREVKAYKSHVKAIMNKGANKLQAGKRIRLTSDSNDYDLHVLADHADDDPSHTLIFFAVTDPAFGKHHTVSSLLKDFRRDFYDAVPVKDLTATSTTSSGGSLTKQTQPVLARLFAQYNVSKLREVQQKVDKVKSVMKENVDKALTNVEHLEEMETKAEQFQEHAKQFSKNSTKLKQLFRCRYYKITGLLALLILAIIGYIIYAIYAKVHG